jgi:probable rRNA maturation factor
VSGDPLEEPVRAIRLPAAAVAADATIEVDLPCPAWRRAYPQAEMLVQGAARLALKRGLAAAGLAPTGHLMLDIRLDEDAEQRRLNRDYRGCDSPTNVLAFPVSAADEAVSDGAPVLLGDVVLAFETVAREAAEQCKPLGDHLRHLVAHGVLHLLGYDHEVPADAEIMEALEREIMNALGVPDPYRDTM